MNTQTLLDIRDLQVGFYVGGDFITAINELNFQIKPGETLGLVGESGCGKSLTSMAIMRLIMYPGSIRSGQLLFNGDDLLKLSERKMRRIRGNDIAMIFQDPMTALNPVFSVGDQLVEPLRLHMKMGKSEALDRAEFMLKEVGLPHPRDQLSRYPHELSGGQRQRVMIAMALSCEPKLLIADEPTTALDVTIQAQILELMQSLQEKYHTGILLITHDLGVIAEMAQRVAVMYAGSIVEIGSVRTVFDDAKHPYTRGLMQAMPGLDTDIEHDHRLYQIRGNVPSLVELPKGCRFQNRCDLVTDECRAALPELRFDGAHGWRCIHVN